YIEGERATSLISQLGCPFRCFTEDTKIITSNGPNKKAKEITIGDRLMAVDEKTMEIKETSVTKVYKYSTDDIIEIEFEDGKIIKTTPEHPFYVKGKWVEAIELKLGDETRELYD